MSQSFRSLLSSRQSWILRFSLYTGTHTTKCIGSNDLRARAHGDIYSVLGQSSESDELVGDDFDANELRDMEDICSRYTKEKGDRVAYVPHDQLQRQVRFAVVCYVDVSVQTVSIASLINSVQGILPSPPA